MTYWLLKFILGPMVKLLWVKKVEGINNIPKEGPLIIASNHTSYLDFFILPAIFPRRIYFLAAEKFFCHPLWRILMKLTGQIRVDRFAEDKKDVYEKALKILEKGKILCIFPEGTRSSTGKIQKAYPGVAKLALSAKVPILPVGIEGDFEILSRYNRSPRIKKICKIKIGKLIKLDEYYEKDSEDTFNVITHNIIMKKIASFSNQKYRYSM